MIKVRLNKMIKTDFENPPPKQQRMLKENAAGITAEFQDSMVYKQLLSNKMLLAFCECIDVDFNNVFLRLKSNEENFKKIVDICSLQVRSITKLQVVSDLLEKLRISNVTEYLEFLSLREVQEAMQLAPEDEDARFWLETQLSRMRLRNTPTYYFERMWTFRYSKIPRQLRSELRDISRTPMVANSTLYWQKNSGKKPISHVISQIHQTSQTLDSACLLSYSVDNFQRSYFVKNKKRFMLLGDAAVKNVRIKYKEQCLIDNDVGFAICPAVSHEDGKAVVEKLVTKSQARRALDVNEHWSKSYYARIEWETPFNPIHRMSNQSKHPEMELSMGMENATPLFCTSFNPDHEVNIAKVIIWIDCINKLIRSSTDASVLHSSTKGYLKVLSGDSKIAGQARRILRAILHKIDPDRYAFTNVTDVDIQTPHSAVVASIVDETSIEPATKVHSTRLKEKAEAKALLSVHPSSNRVPQIGPFEQEADIDEEHITKFFQFFENGSPSTDVSHLRTHMWSAITAARYGRHQPYNGVVQCFVHGEKLAFNLLRPIEVHAVGKMLFPQRTFDDREVTAENISKDSIRAAFYRAKLVLNRTSTLDFDASKLSAGEFLIQVEFWHAVHSVFKFMVAGNAQTAVDDKKKSKESHKEGPFFPLLKKVAGVKGSPGLIFKEKGFDFLYKHFYAILVAFIKRKDELKALCPEYEGILRDISESNTSNTTSQADGLEEVAAGKEESSNGSYDTDSSEDNNRNCDGSSDSRSRMSDSALKKNQALLLHYLSNHLPISLLFFPRVAYGDEQEIEDALYDLKDVLYSVGATHYTSQIVAYLMDLEYLRIKKQPCFSAALKHAAELAGVFIEHIHAWLARNLPPGAHDAEAVNDLIDTFPLVREAERFFQTYTKRTDDTNDNAGKERVLYSSYRVDLNDQVISKLSLLYEAELLNFFKEGSGSCPVIPASVFIKFCEGDQAIEKIARSLDIFKPFEPLPTASTFTDECEGDIYSESIDPLTGKPGYEQQAVIAETHQAKTIQQLFTSFAHGKLPFAARGEGPKFPSMCEIDLLSKSTIQKDTIEEEERESTADESVLKPGENDGYTTPSGTADENYSSDSSVRSSFSCDE